MATETIEQSVQTSTIETTTSGSPAKELRRRLRQTTSIGIALGAAIAGVAAAAILVSSTIGSGEQVGRVANVAPARVVELPAMDASLGYWDFVSVPERAVELPAMDASLGYWDFVGYPKTALPAMPSSMGHWDFTLPGARPAMPASLGYWDFVAYPTAAPLPAMPASMGYWDFVSLPAADRPNSLGFWDFVSLPAPALPPMPTSLGFWDFIR